MVTIIKRPTNTLDGLAGAFPSTTKENMTTKEKVTPPSKQVLKDAAKELTKKHPAGGKILNDQKQAIKQGVVKKT